jgi:hypothetical protein
MSALLRLSAVQRGVRLHHPSGASSMKRYRNLSGDSGVTHYEIGTDYIRVKFHGGKSFRYSNAGAGRQHVDHMKALATAGRALGTYISQHVHDRYDRGM